MLIEHVACTQLDMSTHPSVFPIPGVPVPIMKPFQLWGIPWLFPSGLVWSFSFYFGDSGGCFFWDQKIQSQFSRGPTQWVMALPVAIKFLVPSWLFILSDVKVRGESVRPCLLGICKATVHTGQFSTSGPIEPLLKILEEASAPSTCQMLDTLPDISFTMSGTTLTMTREQYVIMSEAYGKVSCMSAFTPMYSIIPVRICPSLMFT